MAKRRRKGTGSLRRVGGLWYPAYPVRATDEKGDSVVVLVRPENPKSFRLKTDAEAWLLTTRERYEACKVPLRQNLAQGVETIIEAKEGHIANSTIERYRSTLKAARPYLERMPIVDCTPQTMKSFFTRLPIAKSEKPRAYSLCKSLFLWLIETGQMSADPLAGVRKPPSVAERANPFTKEQTMAILKAAVGHRMESFVVVALTTGMRPGEMFGLQWRDVDLANGKIAVRRTLEETAGKVRLKESPKTSASNRTLWLTDYARDVLQAHAARRVREGFVWTTHRRGAPWLRATYGAREWAPLLKKADVPYRRPYECRHTAITLMLLEGVPIKVVSHIAGHASADITLKIYTHLLPGNQEAFVPRIESIFSEAAEDRRRNSCNPASAEIANSL